MTNIQHQDLFARHHEQVLQMMDRIAERNNVLFTSVQKADMSFRLLVQIRNKLMQAYEELNSIRV